MRWTDGCATKWHERGGTRENYKSQHPSPAFWPELAPTALLQPNTSPGKLFRHFVRPWRCRSGSRKPQLTRIRGCTRTPQQVARMRYLRFARAVRLVEPEQNPGLTNRQGATPSHTSTIARIINTPSQLSTSTQTAGVSANRLPSRPGRRAGSIAPNTGRYRVKNFLHPY